MITWRAHIDIGVPKCKKKKKIQKVTYAYKEIVFFLFFSLITNVNIVKFGTIAKVSEKDFRIAMIHFLTPFRLIDMAI